ncbi:MAG TPA: AbrB/MazE/SpoVT family DNA-binding domain-containing protein [Thermoanaerobaculia bacterium]|nr:AbrB/MazE/SpoVT family DNA-binding domain-containing protein [Thermoanaerobaculia bacterium]
MPSTTMTSKGQVTIPKEIREHLGVDTGDRLSFEIRDGGDVVVEPETIDLRSLRSVLRKPPKPVSLGAMERAIRRGASRR